ncbi:MAG TPA: hypothetical protein DDZ53_05075 [Firmicutes bacterium]|nr:hypothetical protein [Bacillota bacterium]
MNQIDILVLVFILFGGWLGSLRSIVSNFISFAGTTLGLAMASLYGSSLTNFWSFLFQRVSISSRWLPIWATTATTNTTNWQQAARIWLDDLLWPASLKQWVAYSWQQLAMDSSFMEWVQVVEQAFWRALSNVCSFLTVIIVVKILVTALAKLSLRLACSDRLGAKWPGFLVGALQSAILVFLIVALAIPFLLLSERTTPMLWPSFTFTLVKTILEHFIVI